MGVAFGLADFGDCGKVIKMSRYRVQSEIETSICVHENASNLRALSILKAGTHTPIFGGSALKPGEPHNGLAGGERLRGKKHEYIQLFMK